jgi:hypothetical protein
VLQNIKSVSITEPDIYDEIKLLERRVKAFENAARLIVGATDSIDERWAISYLKNVLDDRKEQKCVVVGHHSHSHMSIHEKYKGQDLMNGGYHSDLSEFILDHPQVKLWTHGHTHDPFDYVLGETRIVCNPRGYAGHDEHADVFQLKYLEI